MNPQRRSPEWRYALRLAFCERQAAQLVRQGLAFALIPIDRADFQKGDNHDVETTMPPIMV